MFASERARRLVWAALASASLFACDGPTGPAPELSADVLALRQLIHTDPAIAAMAEVDRVADDRPVLGSRLLESGAIPAAQRQLAAARQLELATDQGRGFARRLVTAYEQRVRGLEQYRAFLADQGTDTAALLEATTTMRRAEVAVIGVDRELDLIVPLARRENERSAPSSGSEPSEPSEEDPSP
jgi:hypothetical protein